MSKYRRSAQRSSDEGSITSIAYKFLLAAAVSCACICILPGMLHELSTPTSRNSPHRQLAGEYTFMEPANRRIKTCPKCKDTTGSPSILCKWSKKLVGACSAGPDWYCSKSYFVWRYKCEPMPECPECSKRWIWILNKDDHDAKYTLNVGDSIEARPMNQHKWYSAKVAPYEAKDVLQHRIQDTIRVKYGNHHDPCIKNRVNLDCITFKANIRLPRRRCTCIYPGQCLMCMGKGYIVIANAEKRMRAIEFTFNSDSIY